MSGYNGRNRPAANGGPQGVQRSYASQLKEREPSFHTYEHLQGLPRHDSALTMLRKVASMVKPIMRKRNWRVQVLAEFLPLEQNLLGLNINKGYKICIRLRYHHNPDLFLPMEQVVDTMLHELSHIIWGAHDSNFHRLWDELRDEMETLIRKGYTGEGFLSEGHRLGGRVHAPPPPHEMRRLARASAEKRQAQNKLTKGSGQRLGGTPLHLQGGDVRKIITDQVTRRNTINKGCGSTRADAIQISDDNSNNTFKTKAEEDDANNRAISQALYDLIEEEEDRKLQGTFSAAPTDGGLGWDPANGLYDSKTGTDAAPPIPIDSKPAPNRPPSQNSRTIPRKRLPTDPSLPSTPPPLPAPASAPPQEATRPPPPLIDLTDPSSPTTTTTTTTTTTNPNPPPSTTDWACRICTCINPLQFLACDACGTERPPRVGEPSHKAKANTAPPPTKTNSMPTLSSVQPQSLGWNCAGCGAFMEHKWWTCSACGRLKESS
ncbi:WLM domain-containing protein [Neohortaea acidophila]|uniref:WLM domain-containing protein n=1 Tax=Neohortaea acidophila TaxID=245834 RepID=A0A6A6PTP9_9PEZI|nr:WLM domain-containing protein [Neohortaea acidophila]KAF2482597.1 WLM domain-containing protein [Neohortaea acidophila]